MKHPFAAIALLALCLLIACTKDTGTVNNAPAPSGGGSNPELFSARSNARYSGPNYSQSIPVDSANSMIQSYLNSVQYPSADTALRSLTFDADTLRAYLQNPNIVTLKLIMAHQPAYKNSGNHGLYSGMKPEALTMIVVGLDETDQYVLNNRNEVYEHFNPCPNHCLGNAQPFIY